MLPLSAFNMAVQSWEHSILHREHSSLYFTRNRYWLGCLIFRSTRVSPYGVCLEPLKTMLDRDPADGQPRTLLNGFSWR